MAVFLAPVFAHAKTPNDPQYLDQSEFYAQISAPDAWDYATGSSKVVIAIIDTGIDSWHDDLATNVWVNPYEISDNGIDDDGNGFIDDMHGWNFVENNNNIRPSVFENINDPEAVRHGTIAAGLIGAVGDNGKNGAGLNWQVKIMALRAVDSSGSGSYDSISQAVVYAVKNGASVISMSVVGEGFDENLKKMMRWAYDQGVVLVAAAGNNRYDGRGDLDTNPVYPACFDSGDQENWIIGVTAVNKNDQLSRFADYGQCADIAAPGEKIYSIERYAPDYGYKKNFGGPWQGTSFATPLVAGAAGLIKSLHPEWSAGKIIETILNFGDNISAINQSLGITMPPRLNVGTVVKQAYYSRLPVENISYGLTGNNIWMTTGTKKIDLITVLDARPISFATEYFTDSWSPEFAVLISRPPFLYVQLYKNNGRYWREFSLQNSKNALGQKILVGRDLDGRSILTISKYIRKTNQTVWEVYGMTGDLLQNARYKGVVSDWQMAPNYAGIDAKIKVKGKLTTKRVGWYN